MNKHNTITVNGTTYDIVSGRPLGLAEQTRSSLAIKKPERPAPAVPSESHRIPVHEIHRFSPRPQTKAMAQDIAPTRHPVAERAQVAHTAKKIAIAPRALKPSQVLKNQAIDEAMARAVNHSRKPLKLKKERSPVRQRVNLVATSLAVLLFGGYLTYINMPALSTRVAAAQAGINASYPSYQPSGYSLTGPVAFNNGIVTMTFAANAGPQNYTVTQERSNWDSTAVLENYVQPKAGQDYMTTEANGLTIYSYNRQAAWVNGGILHTITGTANLTPEQIQHIAVSM